MSISLWNEINIWKEIARLNEQLLQIQLAVKEQAEKPKGRKSGT